MGRTVFKGGSKTAWTQGTFNEIKSGVNMPGGPEGGTTEWCIVGSDGRRFSEEGDSGAWVLAVNADLAGILIGGPTTTHCSYVTPIHEVIKDVEASLGCSVSLPEI